MNKNNKKVFPDNDIGEDELAGLADLRRNAPPGFTTRIMTNLRTQENAKPRFWPAGAGWLSPALAGAAVTLLLVALLPGIRRPQTSSEHIVVQFELHAPGVEQVELVGDFTVWQPGRIYLEGPDETGRWTTHIELPAGHYEYMFLVDGRRWVTDPLALTHRPDGFGHLNAILNL